MCLTRTYDINRRTIKYRDRGRMIPGNGREVRSLDFTKRPRLPSVCAGLEMEESRKNGGREAGEVELGEEADAKGIDGDKGMNTNTDKKPNFIQNTLPFVCYKVPFYRNGRREVSGGVVSRRLCVFSWIVQVRSFSNFGRKVDHGIR